MEDREHGGFARKKLSTLGKIAGAAAVAFGAAKTGLLSDRPEDYQLPTGKVNAMEAEHEPNKYAGKPVVNGAAIDKDGNVITAHGLSATPDREVNDLFYKVSTEEPFLLFDSPNKKDRPIPSTSVQSLGIDVHEPLLAQLVYGETYGDPRDPNNVLGSAVVDLQGTHAGEYWKIVDKDQKGEEHVFFTDAASLKVVSEKPVIKLSAGN